MIRTTAPARPQVDPSAFLAPGAVLVGDVTVGPGASIWFHATLRGDLAPIAIGAGSNVQDGCVVHVDHGRPARIGDRVSVGHAAVVHGSEVEDDVIVGMRAVILSGCRIARHCLIGAGALVPEDTLVPEGSLVLGVPARIVRRLRPDEVDRIHENAKSYMELARAYREGAIRGPGVMA
ncbi:MAG: gamma carbonic anhydrase family protein [Acidobacteriota bacterium]